MLASSVSEVTRPIVLKKIACVEQPLTHDLKYIRQGTTCYRKMLMHDRNLTLNA